MEIVTLEEAALYKLVAKVIDHFRSELNPTVEKWGSPERAMGMLNITSPPFKK